MEPIKWDGITDSGLILEALQLLIDEEDKQKAASTSYGDFGKYLQKQYKNAGAGDGKYSVNCSKGEMQVIIKQNNISYALTWNKAAKLIHKYIKENE